MIRPLSAGPPPTTSARTPGGARLLPLQDAAWSDAQRRLATNLGRAQSRPCVTGAYAIWLRTPEIAERAFQYEQVLYGNLAVPLPFIELVVLVAVRALVGRSPALMPCGPGTRTRH